jgi:hypothetical protein
MDFNTVKELLPKQPFVKDLNCFIVFGSSVANSNMGKAPQDVDVCVVVNNRNADLQSVTEFIFKCFPGPDYRIYFLDELNSKLPFMDKGVGVFAMEYFANGISLYGKNIFSEMIKNVDKIKLKESYLNKIFEYVIRIRETRYSLAHDGKYRFWHIHKYLIRLIIDILLYEEVIRYEDLRYKSKYELIEHAKDAGIIPQEVEVNFDSSNSLYLVFDTINRYLVSRDF